MSGNPLGEKIPNPSKYDPGILYAIPRWAARSLLDIDKKLRLYGIDHWHAYEISWLNSRGKPQIALGEFFFNSDSENIVESKSLKLYLNSLNQERFEDRQAITAIIENDLSAVSRSTVKVVLQDAGSPATPAAPRPGKRLDSHDVSIEVFQPDPGLLTRSDELVFDEELYSDLFRSTCPVTGQPDWASVEIRYTGTRIDEANLLAYLCSYREHQGYHEECAERIFRDLYRCIEPNELHLAMNFLRRGGLDINVYRSTEPVTSDRVNPRRLRQ